MGKKNNKSNCSLGRAVINARENLPAAKRKRNKLDLMKNQTQQPDVNSVPAIVDDGDIQKSLSKVESVTEQNDLEEFLAKCELAGAQFTAERSKISVVDVQGSNKLVGVVNQLDPEEMRQKLEMCRQKYREYLRIPRRPPWDSHTTPEQLKLFENEAFLAWRRKLAELEEVEQIVLTPFERNLEIWRQLWRVLERSNIVVQILDARDPLLFRNEDLEAYVDELSRSACEICKDSARNPVSLCNSVDNISSSHQPHKINVLLLNKSDYLTENQRKLWCQYFNQLKIRCVFWSAIDINDNNGNVHSTFYNGPIIEEEDDDSEDSESNSTNTVTDESDEESEEVREQNATTEIPVEKPEVLDDLNTHRLMSRQGFLDYLKNLSRELCGFSHDDAEIVLSVGMIGYPNVGKSSTINKLLLRKKVAVSSTPGKTKHFQTLKVDFADNNNNEKGEPHGELVLCDCPGLVMPSLAMSKEQMFLYGILSADQMRHFEPVIDLMRNKFSRSVFERCYGLTLPKSENNERLKSHDLLTCLAFVRGFMSPKGLPDCSRAARLLVKDCVSGRLLYCQAPPTASTSEQSEFDGYLLPKPTSLSSEDAKGSNLSSDIKAVSQSSISSLPTSEGASESECGEVLRTLRRRRLLECDERALQAGLDREFFTAGRESGAGHVVRPTGRKPVVALADGNGRPPKKLNKNKKRDKLRRVYGYLDA